MSSWLLDGLLWATIAVLWIVGAIAVFLIGYAIRKWHE